MWPKRVFLFIFFFSLFHSRREIPHGSWFGDSSLTRLTRIECCASSGVILDMREALQFYVVVVFLVVARSIRRPPPIWNNQRFDGLICGIQSRIRMAYFYVETRAKPDQVIASINAICFYKWKKVLTLLSYTITSPIWPLQSHLINDRHHSRLWKEFTQWVSVSNNSHLKCSHFPISMYFMARCLSQTFKCQTWLINWPKLYTTSILPFQIRHYL